MTEPQWLTATEPSEMWLFVLERAMQRFRESGDTNDRKMRLFACACCRRVWDLLPDERSRRGIELAERYADGHALSAEEFVAWFAAGAVFAERGSSFLQVSTTDEAAAYWATSCAANVASDVPDIEDAITGAATARAAAAFPGAPIDFLETEEGARASEEALQAEAVEQCHLLRCIFGNPFRPTALDRAGLTPDVLALAQGIYDRRDFARLPYLAAALERHGGGDAELLAHLRAPGPHALGCAALDSVLGKS